MRILRRLQEVSFGITIFFTSLNLQKKVFFVKYPVAYFIIAFSGEYGLNQNALQFHKTLVNMQRTSKSFVEIHFSRKEFLIH